MVDLRFYKDLLKDRYIARPVCTLFFQNIPVANEQNVTVEKILGGKSQ